MHGIDCMVPAKRPYLKSREFAQSVVAEMKEAAGKIEEAEKAGVGDEAAWQQWVKKEEQLREKENNLLQEKIVLLKNKKKLLDDKSAGVCRCL